LVKLTQLEVLHCPPLSDNVPVKSAMAKFTPCIVTEKDPVVGPLSNSEDTTGASKEKTLIPVPTVEAIVYVPVPG